MRALLLLFLINIAFATQTGFRFEEVRMAESGVQRVALADLNDDGKPDVLATIQEKVVWFENPGWQMRVMVDLGGRATEKDLAADPIGRVNRIRHMAAIEESGQAARIYRQPVDPPDPHKGTLRYLTVRSSNPWLQAARISGGVNATAWADLDGDGSDELVVAGDGLRVFDRDPDETWHETRVASGVFSAADAADVDGDGLAEIVAARGDGSVFLYRNRSKVPWRRHVIATGYMNQTVIGGDFTGDGKTDVISTDARGRRTILYVAPDWKPVILQERTAAIHSEIMDVDGDGDLDYIGARYNPGYIFWLENPARPLNEPWPFHLIDDGEQGGVNGVHGLITGDVDGDGKLDLIGNSGQPTGRFPNSIAWFKVPAAPARPWERHVFADGDAPGLSHYHGFGDVNGDGRGDIASAAKIGDDGNWFAWWEQPARHGEQWKKHMISANEPGATNILIADLNGDGRNDFIGSRGHGVGVVWFENPSWRARQIDTRIMGPHSLAVGDIDGDGDLDAATVAKDSHTAAWYENDGAGNFTVHHIHEDQSSYDIRLVDMDGDGDLDLLNAGQESRNVVWFENRIKE